MDLYFEPSCINRQNAALFINGYLHTIIHHHLQPRLLKCTFNWPNVNRHHGSSQTTALPSSRQYEVLLVYVASLGNVTFVFWIKVTGKVVEKITFVLLFSSSSESSNYPDVFSPSDLSLGFCGQARWQNILLQRASFYDQAVLFILWLCLATTCPFRLNSKKGFY